MLFCSREGTYIFQQSFWKDKIHVQGKETQYQIVNS